MFPLFLIQLAAADDKAVHFFELRAKNPEEARLFGNRVYPLDRRLRDEMDIARVAEIFPHEGLDPMQDMPLGKIESCGDPPLQLKGQAVERSSRQIVHLGAHTQQEVIALFKSATFGIAEESPVNEFGSRVDALFEIADP